MTSPALAAYSTQLKRGDAATPEVFTLIAEVGDIEGPTLSSNMEEVTSHSSGGTYESIPTIQTLGKIKFPVNFVPTNATHSYSAGLVKDWKNRTLRNFQMIWPDGTIWAFAAYVAEVAMKAGVKPALSADVTLEVEATYTLA
jgi:hypothetical protein